jgi:hypothetical protein
MKHNTIQNRDGHGLNSDCGRYFFGLALRALMRNLYQSPLDPSTRIWRSEEHPVIGGSSGSILTAGSIVRWLDQINDVQLEEIGYPHIE